MRAVRVTLYYCKTRTGDAVEATCGARPMTRCVALVFVGAGAALDGIVAMSGVRTDGLATPSPCLAGPSPGLALPSPCLEAPSRGLALPPPCLAAALRSLALAS